MLLIPATLLGQDPLPTFNKTFVPNTIGPGSVSTLRFDISNPSTIGVRNLAFTDSLPAGVVIASPANASSSCLGTISAPGGGSTIDFSAGRVLGSSSCAVFVDVTSSAVGTHVNTSGDLTSDAGNSGSATDELTVDAGRPGFSKSFSPSTVTLGSRSTLTFTIDNSASSNPVLNLSFTDNLPLGMTVAGPPNTSSTCGGTLSAVAGSGLISLGPAAPASQLAAGAVCTISVDVIGGAGGPLANVTGELTGIIGFQSVSSGKASDTLTVTVDRLALRKSFTNDPVPPGGTVELRFTIDNFDRGFDVTGITFSDDLGAALSGLEAIDLPKNDVCGPGSVLSGTGVITLTGGVLPPQGSCTFSTTLSVPSEAAPGLYTNSTSTITGDSGGLMVEGSAASDVLSVSPVPMFTKTFLDNPVGAGGMTELEFTITNTSSSSSAADIAFTDIFDNILPTASMVPAAGFCGPDSTATFIPLINPMGGDAQPARLAVADASLDPGASCTFSIILDVSIDANSGDSPNTTSEITATVGGAGVTGNPATDTLVVVEAPTLIKEFTDDPVLPGEMVTLQFTLIHDEFAPGSATGISFSDDLSSALTGLSATGLPLTDVCGTGSQIDGTSNLLFTGGMLDPGETCTFSVTLQVPVDAPFGRHTNATSGVVAMVNGVSATNQSASDELTIAGLTLTKEFIDDPVLPGSTVTLQFTIENLTTDVVASGIQFSDDIDSSLPGLAVAAGEVPQSDICGTGSALNTSGSNLVFQNGLLNGGEMCTFQVVLDVPSDALTDVYPNTTSGFSAIFDGGPRVFLVDALDGLSVNADVLEIAKEFTDDPVAPGDLVNLRFTIDNLDPTRTITDIEFTDDLDAVFSGLASVSGVQTDVCGIGSQISGTSLLSLTFGSLAPAGMVGDSCTFDVTLQVPASVPLSAVGFNETSNVTGMADGIMVVGNAASDSLQIDFLEFAKSFGSNPMPGETVDLTFMIENFDESNSIANLSFQDDLDAVLFGLTAVGLPQADVCGAGSSIDGTSLLSFTGGNLLPAGSCTFTVTLQVPAGAAPGNYANITTDLTQAGLSLNDPATATLIVLEPPADADGDSVLDVDDLCPATVIPESVPTEGLNPNHFALIDDDGIFDTRTKAGKPPEEIFTIADTAGCSCEQIIEAQDLGEGQIKHGCSLGTMRDWVELVGGSAPSSVVRIRGSRQ
ncbi:MAG TPA: hypothetical protein VLU25_06335 [Acidobacteriota bacterium]|nr:hypothetical protein [Acidobacteriota bacterium]